MTDGVPLKFQIGARTLFSIRRRLVRVPLSLGAALAGDVPALPALAAHDQGYLVTSLPIACVAALHAAAPGLRSWERQRYTRHYLDLGLGFEHWLATLSAKSRATLLRKERKFAAASSGTIDVREARTPEEIQRFFNDARAVSKISYQERLLDAGLPDDLDGMLALAGRDAARGFTLHLDGRPISYLYLPAAGDTLIYAYLGFDPAAAALSPGTVLQLGAIRALMAGERFARLDFTEGEGQHKALFASDGIECVDLMLLRPGLGNLAAAGGLRLFDAAVARVKRLAANPRLARLAKVVRR